MKHLSKLFLITFLFVATIACKEDETPAPAVIISGFTPANGAVGSKVTIFGANFGTSPTVTFGSTSATVTTATDTQIETTVPAGASGALAITVTNSSGQSATSATNFTVGGFPTTTVTGNITASTTWNSNTRYILQGIVTVKAGATLTIQPGTVIRGDKASTGTLVIERGAQINANGTAASPIVFTSNQPVGERTYGDWGGIIILGGAPTNQNNPTIEGITGQNYGAATAGAGTATENSGTLRYVRIEFAGVPITPGNEINGLTMGGVGSGTTIEFVQISFCGDDSFEWFGGAVNGKNLISFRSFDDDFDADFGFSGKVQFGLILRDPFQADQSQSNMFECDNDAAGSTTAPRTSAVFSNVTSVGGERGLRGTGSANNVNNANYGRDLHLRRSTAVSIFNSVFLGGNLAGLSLDGTNVQNAFEAVSEPSIQFRGNVFSGTRSASLPARGGVLAFESGAGFATAAGSAQETSFNANNTVVADPATLLLGNLVTFANITNPTLLPGATSPLLTGAVFTGKANDTFFTTNITYRGAFGGTNWTTGWANFDPQTTVY